VVSPFAVSRRQDSTGASRLIVTGEIDQDTSDALATQIANTVRHDGVTELIVDLRHVTFLAAAGVRALLDGFTAASTARRGYRVVNAHGIVHQVLVISGVTELLRVSRDLAPQSSGKL
jgi:anti-anti-sigma factor